MNWQVKLRATVGALALDLELGGDDAPHALVGPNGSGKTTVLRLIAGALRPDAGRIEVGGRVLFDAASRVDVPSEERKVGYVPQGFRLFPHLKVLDNVAFGLAARGVPRASRREAAQRLLADLGISHLAHRTPGALSGGEQQRVALARALAVDPQFILLDEPLSAMDASARRTLRGLLAERLRALPGPALVVTHDVRDIRALGATVHVLEGGRIVQRGPLEALEAAPATDFVAELVGADG